MAIKASDKCFELVRHFEGCELKAYPDSGGLPTIGIGTTFYPDQKPVKLGDTCTIHQAKAWFMLDLKEAEEKLEKYLSKWNRDTMDQYRIDALLSFVYNVGYGETLMKKVNTNPNDVSIWGAFLLYSRVKADKDGKDNDGDGIVDEKGETKQVFGLLRRRQAEAHLYFKNELEFYEDLKK